MKKLLALTFLVACSKANPAEVMVKAQAPSATCVDYGVQGGVAIARCSLKDEKTKEEFQFVAAYSVKHPFQVWSLKTADQQKKEADAYAKAQTEAKAPAPEAGSGSGSGSAAPKK